MHGPLGQQLENGGADVAALATSASAATSAARAVAEAATGVEAELEAASARAKAAARSESRAEGPVVTRIVLAQMITQVIAEVAACLAALLMERAAVAGTEAEAESAGRWCEWVAHMEWFLTFVRKRLVRFRYVNDISEPIVMQRSFSATLSAVASFDGTGSAAQ
jgi:hypothetical protein